jgi:hypothetical protein
MIAHVDEIRQRIPTDTGQFEQNLCDAVGYSTFHIILSSGQFAME